MFSYLTERRTEPSRKVNRKGHADKKPGRPSNRTRLSLEALEDRVVPADLLYTVETTFSDSHLAEVNPATGAIVQTFPTQTGVLIDGMAYDSSTSTLFAFAATEGLYTINTTTGAFTPV